jgi:replicative DNA helicase
VVTVFESLEKAAESEQAGGMAYLGEIANNTPSAANIKRYAEIVRERPSCGSSSRWATRSPPAR